MASSVLVLGDLKGGKLRVLNLATLHRWIEKQPDGAQFRATFELTDPTKRGRLERFYRHILSPQAAETLGYTAWEMHRVFYGTITGTWLELDNPMLLEVPWQMDDDNLSRYVQDAVRIAAEQGCVLSERPE